MSNGYRYTLGTAAKQAKVAKSTLSRAVEKGEISAVREGNGYRIDPAELDRWMSNRPAQPSSAPEVEQIATPDESVALQVANARLEAELQGLKALADELRQDRDEWRKQAQTLLLSDQSSRAEKSSPRGFFGWLGGRRAANG